VVAAAVRGFEGRCAPGGSSLVVRGADHPAQFEIVEVAPLPRKPFAFGFEPRAVVTLRGGANDPAELRQLLQAAFSLTDSEAAVMTKLAVGDARESIAEQRQVALDTVRMQIKRAFAKMNVHREAEFLALIHRLR
jgi:DNA-binding CsgD family transcriptional regulator